MIQKILIVEKTIEEIEEIIKTTILESKGVIISSNSRRIDWNKKYGSQIIDCITFILNEENQIEIKTIVQSEPENKIGNTKTINNFYSNLTLKTPIREIEIDTNINKKKSTNSSNKKFKLKKEEEFKPYFLYLLLGICFIMFVIYQSNKNTNTSNESYNTETDSNTRITGQGFKASYSEETLHNLVTYSVNKDYEAINYLLNSGEIFELPSGQEAYIIESKFGRVKIRLKGDTNEIWTFIEAIKQ